MAENTLNVRLLLKYDTLANWETVKDSFIPMKGEVCIVEVPASSGAVVQEPAILFKVGDGSKKFSQLSYSSAIAADVYDWAKAATKPSYDAEEIENLEDFIKEHSVNDQYRMAKVSDVEWKLQKKDADSTEWSDVDCDHVNLAAALNKKVDREVVSTNGKALIFNEADGGGAKFEHSDGTWSYVGVNDGGKDGVAAQIYAVNKDNVNEGVKLNIKKDGIYYLKNKASSALSADDEIVVKKDIKDIAGGMHFIGSVVPEAGESLEQTIARLYATKGKSYADRKPGDIVIVNTPGISQEYICDSEKQWVELGSEGVYATKAELAAEEEAREDADSTLQTNIDAEALARQNADATLEVAIAAEKSRAEAEEAKKVNREASISANVKSLVSNNPGDEGACLKIEDSANGVWSAVSVNNGGASGIGAQIYDVDSSTLKGVKIDVTKNGAYYVKGDESGKSAAQRDIAANEIATMKAINTDNLLQGSNTFVLYGGSASEVI